jgi:hypothetical protein
MYEDSIKLTEIPEHDSISLCVDVEKDGLFALGEKINGRFEQAYMNGYNWEAVIRCYVAHADPQLMNEVTPDPEAGAYYANMSYSPENLEKMKRFEAHIRSMLQDENALMAFIEEHEDEIEWD